jgi:hypothetical protein
MKPPGRAVAFSVAAMLAGALTPAAAQRVPPADTSRAGATRLPGLVAQAEAEACPGRDDPRARALWTRMREHYEVEMDSASMWVEMQASSGYVASAGLLRFDTVPSRHADGTTDGWNTEQTLRDGQHRGLAFYRAPRVGHGRRGMSGRLRGSLLRTIAREGYATLNRGVSADLTQLSAVWTYPPLDGELAAHFIDDVFGGRTFFRIEREAGPATLAFCTAPRFRSQPYLSGSLFLRADTSLERVQWHFHTPEPREDAGGEVRFHPLQPGARSALTPAQGEIYRRNAGDQFYHRRLVYSAWSIDRAPLLPDSLVPGPAPSRPAIVRHLPPTSGRQP